MQFPRITLAPGASAKVLGISDTLILDAVGSQAESVHLRMMIEQPFQVALKIDPRFSHVESLFEWFAFETKVPHHRSPMMQSAYLRCLLIIALRVHAPKVENENTKRSEVLRRFRHLVEIHYRDHWKVSEYAEALGVEYDRLHRICKRHTERTPSILVHERLIAEAKARLENTGQSVKEIANALGFADDSRFGHFFKKNTGVSPGAYRKYASQLDMDGYRPESGNFADWP
jgi:AraC-like DNA-binding protein